MANKVTIDVEARFVDNVTGKAKGAEKSIDNVGKAAENAQKKLDGMGKNAQKIKVDADNKDAMKKMDEVSRKLSKLGKSKSSVILKAEDKTTTVLNRLMGKVKSFTSRTWNAVIGIKDNVTAKVASAWNKVKSLTSRAWNAVVRLKDSGALSAVERLGNSIKSVTGKTWSVAVKVKDLATAPLRGIKNMLFSIKGLVAAVTAGFAAKQFVVNPIQLADAYSGAQIGFSTLLGESQGQQMMDNLDAFAKATPFGTSDVISQAQRMMAMGWDSNRLIEDMGTIGDAAAATGRGNEGLSRIVLALSQIKTRGRLATQELNQLSEAGIAAKRYLAEGLGYGTGDAGIAKMTKDLEDGKIASEAAIDAILAGMKQYEGMMEQTANKTVSGLWSQIKDTFEINIFRRWGQGLQDGAKRGFGTVVELLNSSEAALARFGDMLYEIGSKISNWFAEKFQKAVDRILKITDTFEFKDASLGEKISMLWKGVIVDPIKEWWEGGGQAKTAASAGKVGRWIGEFMTSSLLAIFGMTDILTDSGFDQEGGMSVAQSFAQGFVDGFDISAITDKFIDAISNVWGALPWWAKLLIGGYAGGKVAGFLGSAIGGAQKIIGGIGTTGTAMVGGTGLLGGLSSAGYAMTGGAAASGLSGGAAALAGGAGIAGGLYAGYKTIGAISDIWSAQKLRQTGREADKTEALARETEGIVTLSGVGAGAAAGAAIGSAVPILGTLIGAGVGALIGGWLGDEAADGIRSARYESEALKEAIEDSDMSAEQLGETLEKHLYQNAKAHFGDIALSVDEISRLSKQIVWGDDIEAFEKFASATETAEANLQSLKNASSQTERWLWKAGLGVEFNADEQKSMRQAFDDYIAAAQSYVENKHYEFAASAELILDLESDTGKSILESGNAWYAEQQAELDAAGKDLGDALTNALADGIITADEEKVITDAQTKIASITKKIADAEADAELDLIKIKFGDSNIDYDSFQSLMAELEANLTSRTQTIEDAVEVQIANLRLRYDGKERDAEFDKQFKAIVEGYKAEVESVRADIMGVELGIVGDAYKDVLGDDAKKKLTDGLTQAIKDGIDSAEMVNIGDEELSKLLKIDPKVLDGRGETADNLKRMMGDVLGQLEEVEVDTDLLMKIGAVETEDDVAGKIGETIPPVVEKTVGLDITGAKNIQNAINILPEDFGIEDEQSAAIMLMLLGDKEIMNQIDTTTLCEDFGVDKDRVEDILFRLQGEKSLENRVTVIAEEFGIDKSQLDTILFSLYGQKDPLNTITVNGKDFSVPDSIYETVKVNITAVAGTISNMIGNVKKKLGFGNGWRGGIFGGSSALQQFARGGIAGYSDGGIVQGGSQLIQVAEEGSPEMVIPLSAQRRVRGLQLWAKAGEMLEAPGFARGGMLDVETEGVRMPQYEGESAPVRGEQSVQVDMGGVSVTVQVNATGGQSVVEAIREQAEDIAEIVTGVLHDAMSAQFENTPLRGGVA